MLSGRVAALGLICTEEGRETTERGPRGIIKLLDHSGPSVSRREDYLHPRPTAVILGEGECRGIVLGGESL